MWYCIETTYQNCVSKSESRFNKLCELHEWLLLEYRSEKTHIANNFPQFPPKHPFYVDHLSASFLQDRRLALERYFLSLANFPEINSHPRLLKALNLGRTEAQKKETLQVCVTRVYCHDGKAFYRVVTITQPSQTVYIVYLRYKDISEAHEIIKGNYANTHHFDSLPQLLHLPKSLVDEILSISFYIITLRLTTWMRNSSTTGGSFWPNISTGWSRCL